MKNYKKILILLITTSIIGLIISIIFGLSEKLGICQPKEWGCIEPLEIVAEPLFFLSIPFLLVIIILFFRPKETFDVWKKFAIIFLPLSIILIAITPVTSYDMMFDYNKEKITWIMSGLFFVISLMVIIINIIKRKK